MNLQAIRKLPEIPEAGATHYATRRFVTDAASVLYARARRARNGGQTRGAGVSHEDKNVTHRRVSIRLEERPLSL
jgi:hypothetical protein